MIISKEIMGTSLNCIELCPSCFPEASSPAICCSPLMTTVHAMHKVCNLGQSWIDLGPNSLDCKGGGAIQSRDHQPEVTKLDGATG